MIPEIVWRVVISLTAVLVIGIMNLVISFFIYKVTEGQIYQRFKRQRKRFIIGSFVMAFIFALTSMIPDLMDILLAPLMTVPIDISNSIKFAITQFFIIFLLGTSIRFTNLCIRRN